MSAIQGQLFNCVSLYIYVVLKQNVNVSICRILSIACSPSTFAVSASDTVLPLSSSSHRTLTLTSPSLPSHRAAAEMAALDSKGGIPGGAGGGGGDSFGGRGTRGDLPIPGGVYIWDLKSQKMKV